MIDHFRESVGLAAQQPGAGIALAALAVGVLAALVVLGLLAVQPVPRKATLLPVVLAAVGWLGSVCLAVAMVRDGQQESLRLWHERTAEVSALNAAAARAEAGHTLLALSVLSVCGFCVALSLGRGVSAFRRGTALPRVALPGTLALLTGALGYGLVRRIDLTYLEVECGAAFLCLGPVTSGTVALTAKLRTILLVGATVATGGALLLARRLSPPSKAGLVIAASVFVLGAGSWGATRRFRIDASTPLPERGITRVGCPVALARADSLPKDCSACGASRWGPVIAVRGAVVDINGKIAPPDALTAERAKYYPPRLPPPSVVLIDRRSDFRATIRSLAMIRDRYAWLAEVGIQEAAPRTMQTETTGKIELPAQCCCIRVELLEGEPPIDWDALVRAAESGKLPVGPKAESTER